MRPKLNSAFLRFLIAGAVNTLFGWLVYSAAIVLNLPPWLALITGTVAGVVFNFISVGGYVFRDMALGRLPRFILSYGFIYLINLVCLNMLRAWIDNPILAQLALTPPMAILSYVVLSRLVFTARSTKNNGSIISGKG